MRNNQQKKEKNDVLIICALKDEFEQLINVEQDKWKLKTSKSGWLIANAIFEGVGGVNFSVRATWSPSMGREAVLALIQNMLSEVDVNCIAMTGICAGRRGKVSLGDVIFADRLWSYDSGKKVVENGVEFFQGDQIQYQLQPKLVQRIQNLNVDNELWPIERPPVLVSKPFNIHIAPIATGAAVIEDINIFKNLSNSMRKVLGIDMEASALGTIGAFNQIPIIVAKAVSDFADENKDDRFRDFASYASAHCMIQLLKNCTDLLVKQENSYTEQVIIFDDKDLINFLAEEYPDAVNARAIWKKAGGANADIIGSLRPRDMWQDLWRRVCNGAVVTQLNLLNEVIKDYPENPIIKFYLQQFYNEN